MLSHVTDRRWSCALLLGVPFLLGACASVQDMVGIPRSGHQSNGTYVVGTEEEKLACRQIEDRVAFLGRQMEALPEKAALERQSRPSTVGSALGRVFGGPDAGLQATKEMQRARAESDALKALMIRKQCI